MAIKVTFFLRGDSLKRRTIRYRLAPGVQALSLRLTVNFITCNMFNLRPDNLLRGYLNHNYTENKLLVMFLSCLCHIN